MRAVVALAIPVLLAAPLDAGSEEGSDATPWRAARIAEDASTRARETSATGIEENVARLGRRGSAEAQAAFWLAVAGPAAVPALENRLSDTEDDRALVLVLSLLGELGGPDSATKILDFLRPRLDDGRFVKPAFLALAGLEPNEDSAAFALAQARASATPSAVRGALVLLAAYRDPRAEEEARSLVATSEDPRGRAVAILYLARIGRPEAADLAMDWIRGHPDERTDGTMLVRAAAEVLRPDALRRLAGGLAGVAGLELEAAVRRSRFLHEEGEERLAAAADLLRESEHPWDRREAIRAILDAGAADRLAPWLDSDPPYVYPLGLMLGQSSLGRAIVAEAGRRGLTLTPTESGYRLRPR